MFCHFFTAMYSEKKSFTLIETIIALVMVGIGVLAILSAIQYAVRAMNMTRSQVVATNLARDMIEVVYNKRDSNRQAFPSKKDECWLASRTPSNASNCEAYGWFWSKEWLSDANPLNRRIFPSNIAWETVLRSVWWQNSIDNNGSMVFWPVLLAKDFPWFTESNFFPDTWIEALQNDLNPKLVKYRWTTIRKELLNGFRLCSVNNSRLWMCWSFNGSRVRTPNPNATAKTKYWQFRRYVSTNGIIDKNTNTDVSDLCVSWESVANWVPCWGDWPKELRFCGIVDYSWEWPARRVQLCSVITNFVE